VHLFLLIILFLFLLFCGASVFTSNILDLFDFAFVFLELFVAGIMFSMFLEMVLEELLQMCVIKMF